MEGFLPRIGSERRRRIVALMADECTSVVPEALGRVRATLGELALRDAHLLVAVMRELTKLYEGVWRGPLGDAATDFASRQPWGEVVLVIGGAPTPSPAGERS